MILYYRLSDNTTEVILASATPHLTAARTNYCCVWGECIKVVRSEPWWEAEAGLKAEVRKFIPVRILSQLG